MTALLAESEGVVEDQGGQEQADDLDALFDDDSNEEEEYKEGTEEEERNAGTDDVVSDLFGDVDDIENEEKDTTGKSSGAEAKSKKDLQGLCHSSRSLNPFMCKVI